MLVGLAEEKLNNYPGVTVSLTPEEQFELGITYLRSFEQHKDFSEKTGSHDPDIDEYHAKAAKWLALAGEGGHVTLAAADDWTVL